MSFLTAVPQELAAAAAQLGAIGAALAGQNAGAAAPTTAIAPAAADQVSILQSGIFTAYGALYQQIAAEAQAIQEQFVQTLGLSSGTYEQSEAANAAAATAASAPGDFINQISTLLGGPVTSFGGQPFSLSGNFANFSSFEIGNWASASSNLLGLTGGGLFPDGYGVPEDLAAAAEAATAAEGATAAGAVSAVSGGPVAAALGTSTLVGSMSAPPSWAAGATLVSNTAPSALAGAGWTSAAPAATTGGFYPGMPGVASAARNSAGFGAPRYGVKPIVMPKPVSV
ncbi:PPE family protein, SVP subgroup [Mycobacterium asiaticum]|uniref:PPE family protein, SVP subgroup n=1 Tax=Mycobacterium asiaticum TaxID=1790 RepID=UPI0007F000EE|nr:PE domain-containing protein [Mycobacterium asiaticum]OBI95031.1 PE family protein [Mycobacterium asiaticum]